MILQFVSSSQPRIGLSAVLVEPPSDPLFPPKLSAPPLLVLSLSLSLKNKPNISGTWVARSVERPTSAQVMISQFVGSSPASGSVMLTARSLEPASGSVSPLSPPLPRSHFVSLSLKNKKHEKFS